ncbi:MAG: right-handed parallel beta-helix repeat-containing protein [Phycisphaerae bacterium]|nr:right-handed parallel beta-helix repeat-containing protein [Phycisphaerae bacterium]
MRGPVISTLMAILSCGTVYPAGGATVLYRYEDDCSQDLAMDQSLIHSVFWVKGAFPPTQPYLAYWTPQAGDRAILFRDHSGQPASLGYAIPVLPDDRVWADPVTVNLGLDVQLLSTDDPSRPATGYLLYTVSADGTTWSTPRALSPGRCQVHLGDLRDNRYLLLTGTLAVVDNLTIEITRPSVTLYVPQDARTLQEALDRAQSGDRIVVSDNTYAGPGNRDLRFRGKDICLVSANGPERCVIDCEEQGRAFLFDQGESRDAIVDGFTIVNGRAPAGAGVYCENSSPTLSNCHIRRCQAIGTTGPGQGGGIYVKGGRPLIRHCRIYQNEAASYALSAGGAGGGCFLTDDGGTTIEHCTFESNVAIAGSTTYNKGGGLFMEGTPGLSVQGPTLRNSLFTHNSAVDSGGAIACIDTPASIIHCTITGNTADRAGAGLFVSLTQPVSEAVTVKNCIVWDNGTDEIARAGAGASGLVVRYSDVQGGMAGEGNINADPLFASPFAGDSQDIRLLSFAGRWDPQAGMWVHDWVTSPCIDAGDPGDGVGPEPTPNGDRVDMGCTGGTPEASKGSGPLVFHVDLAGGSDQNTGLSPDTALASIQKAVGMARDGDAVLIWPGTYREEVDFAGKAITIQSAADPATVIASQGGYAFSLYHQEGPSSVLRNLVIRDCPEAGILCHTGAPTLSHLTIVRCGVGIAVLENAQPTISHCILWENTKADLQNCQAQYSCIERPEQAGGAGSIRRAPLFVNPDQGDFHLQSRYGRYWPLHNVWVVDDQTSPCIDAGDPSIYPTEEPSENGGRLNLGADGGTGYASMSPPRLSGGRSPYSTADLRATTTPVDLSL